jgi:hypothetical protein
VFLIWLRVKVGDAKCPSVKEELNNKKLQVSNKKPNWGSSWFYICSKRELAFYAFTGDFDLPKRICSNGLFWYFLDKVSHFLIIIFKFGDVEFFARYDGSICGFEKSLTNFAK